MNGLIEKSVTISIEQYQEKWQNMEHGIKCFVIVTVISLILTYIFYVTFQNNKDLIIGIIFITQSLISFISAVSLIVMTILSIIFLTCMIPNSTKIRTNTSLINIKEHMEIHDDKLTINSLPENYYYKNRALDRTKPHDFCNNNFYRENNPKLIDNTGQEYEITQKELDELKKIKERV